MNIIDWFTVLGLVFKAASLFLMLVICVTEVDERKHYPRCVFALIVLGLLGCALTSITERNKSIELESLMAVVNVSLDYAMSFGIAITLGISCFFAFLYNSKARNNPGLETK